MELDVSVIVVTYNSAPCIAECLGSVLKQKGVQLEVVVVDNASSDETVNLVPALGARIHLLSNQENIGFGQGCNQGFAASCGRYLFLLNPDAWLEQSDGVARLLECMQNNTRWGLAGTRVVGSDGVTESPPAACYPNQRHVHCDFSRLPGNIAWVLGASMFIRREAFSAAGGFDPAFFLYSEETDLCLRLRQLGSEIGFVPEVTVRHIGGMSERGNDPYTTWLRRSPSLYRFWSKHYPPADVRRLLRREWFRAGFRRGWYAILARLLGPGSTAWSKHRRYEAISEASWRSLRLGHIPQAGRTSSGAAEPPNTTLSEAGVTAVCRPSVS